MENTILPLEKSAMERWRSGDPMGFVEISTEDVLYVDPGLTKPVLNLEEYRSLMEQIIGKVNYQISEFIQPKVTVAGDAALLTYNYRSTATNPDGTVKSQNRWNTTEVYFRRNGQWKIVHTHWSFVKHRQPERIELPLPVQSPPAEYDGVLAELMALETAAMARYDKGDPWGFTDISAPEVTYFDSITEQRINGIEELRAEYAKRVGKINYEVLDFVDPHIRVCGEIAVLFYRFLSTRLNPDNTVACRKPWNCSEVFRKIDGQWKIIHTHWSLINGVRI